MPERDEQGKIIPIDAFLLSKGGRQDMAEFTAQLDMMNDLTQHMLYTFREVAKPRHPTTPSPAPFVTQLVQRHPEAGLNRPELETLILQNPVIDHLMQCIERARREGATDTPRLYNNIMLVMMNVIRAEALRGIYDPHAAKWAEWAEKLRYRKGHEHILNHPTRSNPQTRFTG